MKKITNYVVMVAGEFECKLATLKEARNYKRSLININEIRGIETVVDIFKETIISKKLSSDKSSTDIVGKPDKVFKEFQ